MKDFWIWIGENYELDNPVEYDWVIANLSMLYSDYTKFILNIKEEKFNGKS